MTGRDVIDEQRLVVAAAEMLATPEPFEHDVTVATAALNAFALERAGSGPVRDHASRDMGREALEELADCRNYLLWWRSQPGTPSWLAEMIDDALGQLVALYAVVLAARTRQTTRPERPGLARAIDETAGQYPRCRCRLHPAMADAELVALGCGCTDPLYVCPRLDTIRRRIL